MFIYDHHASASFKVTAVTVLGLGYYNHSFAYSHQHKSRKLAVLNYSRYIKTSEFIFVKTIMGRCANIGRNQILTSAYSQTCNNAFLPQYKK